MVSTCSSASGTFWVTTWCTLPETKCSIRWILIAFKREFPFEDVLRLWEVLWTDYYSTQFVLFVALGVLESHRDVILRYLVEVRYTVSFLPRALISNTGSSVTSLYSQFDEILKVRARPLISE